MRKKKADLLTQATEAAISLALPVLPRLIEEWKFVGEEKIEKLLQPATVPVPVAVALSRPDVLLLSAVLGRLDTVVHPTPPIDGMADFLRRVKRARALGAKFNKKQMVELILGGAFGDPAVAMVEYWQLDNRDDEMPALNFGRELALRMCRVQNLNLEDIEQHVGYRLISYQEYLSPFFEGRHVWVAGQVAEDPHVITSKKGPMAFLDLHPLDRPENLEDFDEPTFQLIFWADHYPRLMRLGIAKGDILVMSGKQSYNEKRGNPQITTVDESRVEIWTA